MSTRFSGQNLSMRGVTAVRPPLPALTGRVEMLEGRTLWSVSHAAASSAPHVTADPPALKIPDFTVPSPDPNSTVDESQLDPRLQKALNKFRSLLGEKGVTLKVTSAYRTPQYQTHLRAISDTYAALLDLLPGDAITGGLKGGYPTLTFDADAVPDEYASYDSAINAEVVKVNAEIKHHGLTTGSAADDYVPKVAKISKHNAQLADGTPAALAFDCRFTGSIAAADLAKLADQAGVVRRVEGDNVHYELAPQKEIAFVIDTTSSMTDDIAAVKARAADIIDAVKKQSPNAEIGVMLYKDAGDIYQYKPLLQFTNDADAVKAAIQTITVSGGGDIPESVYSGMTETINGALGKWNDNTGDDGTKNLIVMGDAAAHDPDVGTGYTLASVTALAKKGGLTFGDLPTGTDSPNALSPDAVAAADPIHVYTVGIRNDPDMIANFKAIAAANEGQFVTAADTSKVVDALIKVIGDTGGGGGGTTTTDKIKSYVLVNAHTGKDIETIHAGQTLNLADLPTTDLNIRAVTDPGTVGSVRVTYDGKTTLQNGAPYTVFGDNHGVYLGGTLTLGHHTLSDTPYTLSGAKGTAGAALSIDFTVVNHHKPAVTGYVLVNADTGKDIGPIKAGSTIDLAALPTKHVNIRVATSPAVVGSVRLSYDGKTVVQNGTPYSVFGDTAGKYVSAALTAGTHTLSATPYSASKAGGTKGTPLSITFKVVSHAKPAITALELYDAKADKALKPLKNGAVLDLSDLGTSKLTVRALTTPSAVGSVRFVLDGHVKAVENADPYSLFGNHLADYFAGTLAIGSHTLVVTPYTSKNGKGTAGTSLTVHFKVKA